MGGWVGLGVGGWVGEGVRASERASNSKRAFQQRKFGEESWGLGEETRLE